jgi:hypothetical protein
MSYILYQLPNEPVAVVSPTGEVPIPQLIPMVVPAGANYKLVETVPVYDPTVYFLELTPEGSEEPYVILPLPLTQSKASYTTAINEKAYTILQPSDWLTSRAFEEGTEIPPDWNTWRQAVRDEARAKVQTVNDCQTAEELETYVTSEAYSYWPPEPTTPA